MDRRDLERLGHHVVSRRVALGYRNRTDLANSLQFTVRTLADIEHGVRKASPGTYAMLENKLAWAPGSIDTILAGGEPKETRGPRCAAATPTPPRDTHCARPPNALSQASTEELLLELRRRIIAPRDRRHETWDDWDGGLDPHGDWPEEGKAPKISGGAVGQADPDAGLTPGEQQFVRNRVAVGWTPANGVSGDGCGGLQRLRPGLRSWTTWASVATPEVDRQVRGVFDHDHT